MALKIPNIFHCKTFQKFTQIWIFGFENKPSGSTELEWNCQLAFLHFVQNLGPILHTYKQIRMYIHGQFARLGFKIQSGLVLDKKVDKTKGYIPPHVSRKGSATKNG
jgi:hypothetical protein